MAYRVDITERAERDLERLYLTIEADNTPQAHTWFNGLERTILSLDEHKARGASTPESSELRHLLYRRKGHRYRIIYTIDDANLVVTVLHIRHGARGSFRNDESDLAA
jgi:plasmid stabilization system protein ParE